MSLTTRFSKSLICCSEEETLALGRWIGQTLLHPSLTLTFTGELGAGKTTLVKGIYQGWNKKEPLEVHSPTFTYLNVYDGGLCHFDLYRLEQQNQFLAMGFDEYFFNGSICLIEWPEVITPLLPQNTLHITCSHAQEGAREITIQ